MFKVGVEGKAMRASYDYFSWILRRSIANNMIVDRYDTNAALASPGGTMLGSYMSQRVRLLPSLIAEAGVRTTTRPMRTTETSARV